MLITPTPLALGWPLQLQYFPGWAALVAFLVLGAIVVLLGMRSLNGLGPARKWVAIGVRLAVVLLLILILGGVRWSRNHTDLEIMIVQDISDSMENVSTFPGRDARDEKDRRTLQQSLDAYYRQLSRDPTKKDDDRVGLITFKDYAKVDAMPNKELRLDTRGIAPKGSGTDVAAGLQLAMATMSPDAMHRLVLVSDGNPNLGDTDAAVNAAVAQGVPIDVVAMAYDVQNDVMVDRFVSPSWKRENEPFTLTVVLRNANPAPVAGRLRVVHRTDLEADLDMDPALPEVQRERAISLKPGLNPQYIKVPPLVGGVHRFKAIFTPDKAGTAGVTAGIEGGQDTAGGATAGGTGGASGGAGSAGAARGGGNNAVEDNDVAEAVTLVRGKGEVLYIDNTAVPGQESPGAVLAKAMAGEGITMRTFGIDGFPRTLVELQNYDAVVLANVPRGNFTDNGRAAGLSLDQDAMLRTYVHDMGGGLVMIGGEQTFGAGGWASSEVEKVLPVDMEIPAQRQVGQGALALVMHSCEMPQGNFWGEQCAIKAVESLGSRDEIGIISYGMGVNNAGIGGAQWDFPLSEKKNGQAVFGAIKKMQLGDMPSFDDAMNLALNGVNGQGGLKQSKARHKHVIIISDGDPQVPIPSLVAAYQAAKVSCSTITVYPHGGGAGANGQLPPVMFELPKQLKGKSYGPIESNPNQLPQIFIKEATIVKRSLIFEENIAVAMRDPTNEMVKGLGERVPNVAGMVLTSRKNDPKVEMPLSAGKLSDPILAHWQTGLGRAAVWTSDATAKWSPGWVGSPSYNKLWAQIIRGVSRPPMSSDFDVRVNIEGNRGEIIVDAMDKDADALNFLNMTGTVLGGSDLRRAPEKVRLVQVGPGRYRGSFAVHGEGSYVAGIDYQGRKGVSGNTMGVANVNTSPEKRDLKSNESRLRSIAEATGGRWLTPFQPQGAELFTRDGLRPSRSPLPVWDLLLPYLLALIILDVAVRRIAWDWNSTKRMATAVGDRVRAYTTMRRVESAPTLDALRRVRDEVVETKFGGAGEPAGGGAKLQAARRPDPKAKFVAPAGVEGDIAQVVGGATDKPLPSAPKKIEPKGGPAQPGGHMGGLMAAKKRAQQQIKDKESGEGGPS